MRPLVALMVIVPLLASSNAFADMVSAITAAERMGLSPAAIARVERGEVVAEGLEASSDKDLSLAVVMRIDATLSAIFDFIDADRMVEFQTARSSSGAIDPANPSLSELHLSEHLVEKLARDPGGTFFMSAREAEGISEAAQEGAAYALGAYRAALATRARAYWENGLAGIEPYSGTNRSPLIDLGHANDATKLLMKSSTFLAELDTVPAQSPGNAIHKLSWAIEKSRDQAAPVLIHRILYREDDGEILVERRFYSGYDYDALQIVVGVLPTPSQWSAVFYTNHTFTSQVTGFGGSAKRSIGRKILKTELVAEMIRARQAIAVP